MFEAIENKYDKGICKIVTCEELEKLNMCSIPIHTKRFFCKECGEYVAFIRGYKISSHFKHDKEENSTGDCGGYEVKNNRESIFCEKGEKKFEVLIYPAMWKLDRDLLPKNKIPITDRLIKKALPEAYHQLEIEIRNL